MIKKIIILLLLISSDCFGQSRLQPEKVYQEQFCKEMNGEVEVVLPDRTRCDCITSTHSIEVDFANKWTEAVGQSLYYSLQTNKKAGIYLILESPKDRKYLIRLNSVIEHFGLPIDVWAIEP